MQANAVELPLRGNYFAEADYLEPDLRAGRLHNRAAAPMFALPDELMVVLSNTIMKDRGERGVAVLKAIGRGWGRQAAEQFTKELSEFRCRQLAEQPLALLAADLTAAFLHHGWGRVQFDFSRYAAGLLLVEVSHPFLGEVVKPSNRPVEPITAGFLGGMFSQFSGVELDCVQSACRACGAPSSQFILTVPERLKAVADWAEAGRAHAEVLAELEKPAVP